MILQITEIRATPLFLPYKETYHWAQGTLAGAEVVLVEVESAEGVVGVGESMGGPDAGVMAALVRQVGSRFVGSSPFDIARLTTDAYKACFAAVGTGSAPRFAAQVLAGLELAFWDLVGKVLGQPVHRLWGGAVHPEISYFGFLQGDTAGALARDAKRAIDEGFSVIYMKIGRGEAIDLDNVAAVRSAIGGRRLRLDANEAWDVLTARRMFGKLAAFEPEFVEQPTPSHSLEALAQLKASVDIPIAVDQRVFSPSEVYEVCRRHLADVLVLGLHEAGGFLGLKKAAAIAEAAGVNICLHGVYETGITTCAANQAAATIPNLDDGNQIMVQLLEEDIVASPTLSPQDGKLPVMTGVGLGFELDRDAVARAAERYQKRARFAS